MALIMRTTTGEASAEVKEVDCDEHTVDKLPKTEEQHGCAEDRSVGRNVELIR